MVGRNDPCPCGSGKKYKKCCLLREAESADDADPLGVELEDAPGSADPELEAWKQADLDLIRRGMERIARSNPNLGRLVEDYWGAEARQRWRNGELSAEEEQQFFCWLWLDRRRSANDKTFAERLAAEGSLPERQRQILASLLASHMSVYQVVRVEPSVGVELENVLEGGTIFVHDLRLSLSAEKWALTFGRTYTAGPYHFLTNAAYAFPPRNKEFIVAYLTRKLNQSRSRRGEGGWKELLKSRADVFADLTVELLRPARQLPELANSDGDPLALCKVEYRLSDAQQFVSELRSHPELQQETDRQDEIQRFLWFRCQPDGDLHLGNVTVTGDELVFECNSRERLARGIEILRACGELELVREDIKSGGEIWDHVRKQAESRDSAARDAEAPPEAQAFLREHLNRHYEKWVDESLPALGGQTPRQAAKTPAGRKKLTDLLRTMEFGDRHLSDESALKYDWNQLRRRLGLPLE